MENLLHPLCRRPLVGLKSGLYLQPTTTGLTLQPHFREAQRVGEGAKLVAKLNLIDMVV
jgi:hypothetical protein